MNLVISGARGLVGKTIKESARSNFRIIEMNRNEFNIDSMQEVSKKIQGKYAFLHLAWPVSNPDYLNSEANLSFLRQSKDLMAFLGNDNNCDLILGVGTILEHGSVRYVKDNTPTDPESLYAEAKVKLSEFLLQNFPEKSKWIRIGYQISALDPEYKLVPSLLSNKSIHNPVKTPYKILDFIHRFDVGSGILSILKNHLTIEEFYILVSTGRGIPIYELANEFLDEPIRKPKKIEFSQSTDPQILKSIGWSAQYLSVSDVASVIRKENSEIKKNTMK
jgi:nucleoside-diphosphate-sugar epimerase